MKTKQQDELVTQTESQRDCGQARPEDFHISTPDDIANRETPFGGQRGESRKEYTKLLAESVSKKGKSKPTGYGLQKDRMLVPQGKR
jgi:hypothetical protein